MKVTLNHSENLHFTANARDFKTIHTDEPESFHGTNFGPSPIEYLLIGIGGCISSSFVYCLKKKGVEFEELDVIVDGTLKHVGPKMKLRLVNIDLDLQISFKEGESNEKIDLCEEIFKENCPITDIFTGGVPLNIRISKKNVKR